MVGEGSDRKMGDRAMGALISGALGDALGMPTQLLSPGQIAASYGFVDRFVAPLPDHPVSRPCCKTTGTQPACLAVDSD